MKPVLDLIHKIMAAAVKSGVLARVVQAWERAEQTQADKRKTRGASPSARRNSEPS
jgi:hypothetical protein